MKEDKRKMDQIKIVIPLNPVSKKNSAMIIGMGKRCPVCKKASKNIIVPSKAYQKYEKEVAKFLRPLYKYHIDYPVNVQCLFYMQTRRKCDLNNMLESATDVLVKYGILADDNSGIVAGHDGSRVKYDKDFPRTEIVITPLEE